MTIDLEERRRFLKVAAHLPSIEAAGALCAPRDRQLATMPDVLLIRHLCQLLHCSRNTIGRRLEAGLFPVPPLDSIDNRRRWSKRQVARWLDGEPPRPSLLRRRRRA